MKKGYILKNRDDFEIEEIISQGDCNDGTYNYFVLGIQDTYKWDKTLDIRKEYCSDCFPTKQDAISKIKEKLFGGINDNEVKIEREKARLMLLNEGMDKPMTDLMLELIQDLYSRYIEEKQPGCSIDVRFLIRDNIEKRIMELEKQNSEYKKDCDYGDKEFEKLGDNGDENK